MNLFREISIITFLTACSIAHAKDKISPIRSIPKTFNEISFTENKGQIADQNKQPRTDVLFGGTSGNLTFHIKNNGISYQLNRVDKWKEVEANKDELGLPNNETKNNKIEKQTIYRIDINWLNTNNNYKIKTDKALTGFNNYYLPQCPNGALNVKSYEGVTLENIYTNIDLHYYQKNGQLKYDYIVAPHANYKQIQLEIKGAGIIKNADGSLLLKTPLGNIEEGKPIVYQNGKELKARWIIKENILSFEVDDYNPNFELIIDPVTRLWGTYYGGSGNSDRSWGCTTDANSNVYITGYSNSTGGNIIATVGAHQTILAGSLDAILVKFNSNGVRQWGTYYGGSGNDDQGRCCTTDASGNIYMTGYTNSSGGTSIATTGSHQDTYGGAPYDAFLVKFDANGVRQWGTYYGGTSTDQGFGCATDLSGNIYLVGGTSSLGGTAIATPGSHSDVIGGGPDAFLVKFNSAGVRQWGTYYGGTNGQEGARCTTDALGNVYIVGETSSGTGTGVATPASHQPLFGGGTGTDAFLVKFNSAGVRQWGTYYGGTGTLDRAFSCTSDAAGNIFMTGYTNSTTGTIIATPGSHQSVYGGSTLDAFLVKFDGNGNRLWGTYYGGSGGDYGYACSTDSNGEVFMAGYTTSTVGTTIATPGSHQDTHGGGNIDAYLVAFNSNGARQWATYYGGVNDDRGLDCATDVNGNVYLAGMAGATSGTVIATTGAHQNSYGGGTFDAFLVKFSDCVPSNPSGANVSGCANNTSTLTATSGTSTINWFATPSSTTVLGTGTAYITPTLSAGTYTYYAEAFGCVQSLTRTAITLTVNPSPTITVNSGAICNGQSFTMTPSGASTYTFQGGNAVVSPTSNTNFTVVGTNSLGCVSNSFATATITVNATPTITVNSVAICNGQSFTMTPSGASTYTFQGGNAVVSPTVNSSYTVVGTSSAGCVSIASAVSNITVNALPTVVINGATLICIGQSATLTANGAVSYSWNTSAITSVIVVSPSVTTMYTVTGSDANGCSNSAVMNLNVSICTGINNAVLSSSDILQIYPIPFRDIITIKSSYLNQPIKIYNSLGALIYKDVIVDEEMALNLSTLPAGIYFIQINTITQKIIKE
ncbi:MAG: SBBP repeat-containing protein [Bacteroidota bacterium]|nr:SBBP repeat-containing protein [Bacteroidota bacterium]MDP3144945.1 SBBP repeat-containing protein [Bacteroidota bacterium]